MLNKNKEGYQDPTAGQAIREASKQPRHVEWYIKAIKDLAAIMDLGVVGRVAVRDKTSRKMYT